MTLFISHVSVLTPTWEAEGVKCHICCKMCYELNASYLGVPRGGLFGLPILHWLDVGIVLTSLIQ